MVIRTFIKNNKRRWGYRILFQQGLHDFHYTSLSFSLQYNLSFPSQR
jgi:hypothetical protein